MSKFKVGQAIEWTVVHSSEREFYRILWKNEKADKVWLIKIPPANVRNDYCRGPFIVSLSELSEMLDNLHIVVSDMETQPFWLLPDDAIRERYSKKDGKCSTIVGRDKRWSWISDLFLGHSLEDIFETNLISAWVPKKAKEVAKAKAKLLISVQN